MGSAPMLRDEARPFTGNTSFSGYVTVSKVGGREGEGFISSSPGEGRFET